MVVWQISFTTTTIKHYTSDPTFTFWCLWEVQHLPLEALAKVMRPHTDMSVSPHGKPFQN